MWIITKENEDVINSFGEEGASLCASRVIVCLFCKR